MILALGHTDALKNLIIQDQQLNPVSSETNGKNYYSPNVERVPCESLAWASWSLAFLGNYQYSYGPTRPQDPLVKITSTIPTSSKK
ncbi:hypothetical protein D3C76_1054690 [compost metagenome]